MRYLLLSCLLLGLNWATAQGVPNPIESAKAIVEDFFKALNTSDSALMKPLLAEGLILVSVEEDAQGVVKRNMEDANSLLIMVGQKRNAKIEERLTSIDLTLERDLAIVWAPYVLFVNDHVHHCGTNVFQLTREGKAWKISGITDSRRVEGCPEVVGPEDFNIHVTIDRWHRAAAKADSATFFGSMTPEAIYLGTDDSERWQRDEFANWAAPFFRKGKAWDFTPHHRKLYYSPDGKTVWFEEKLDTWMGPCRGSGVMLQQADKKWKLAHYNLSVTIPNDKMDGFLDLMKQE
jgi:hypothetical protein